MPLVFPEVLTFMKNKKKYGIDVDGMGLIEICAIPLKTNENSTADVGSQGMLHSLCFLLV